MQTANTIVVAFLVFGLALASIWGYLKYDSKIVGLQEEVSDLREMVRDLTFEVSKLNAAVDDYKSQLSASQARFDKVLNSTMALRYIAPIESYQWELVQCWSLAELPHVMWELKVPLSTYLEYCEMPRLTYANGGWVTMATDSKDDLYICQMAQQINNTFEWLFQWGTEPRGPKAIERINLVAGFVQSLAYVDDNATTGFIEYPRYPLETLFDGGGDCEDKSILAAALLDDMGYDVALVVFEHHASVGVSVPGASGDYYEYNGKGYFLLEVTNVGATLGNPCVESGKLGSPTIFPLNP